jgi:hypothetical protein
MIACPRGERFWKNFDAKLVFDFCFDRMGRIDNASSGQTREGLSLFLSAARLGGISGSSD